jgi:hypothetical protein
MQLLADGGVGRPFESVESIAVDRVRKHAGKSDED